MFLILFLSCRFGAEKDSQEDTTNPSAGQPNGEDCPSLKEFYISSLEDVVEGRCVGCHVSGGLAEDTRLLLTPSATDDNIETLSSLAFVVEDDGYLLWLKPTGQHVTGHVGGEVLPYGSAEAEALSLFIGRANGVIDDCEVEFDPTTEVLDCTTASAGERLLRRLSHVEYDNSIRDIFGIESNWGDAFAPDNVVHGYNNNAAALKVSSLLADQYMNAAEEIANQVMYSRANEILSCPVTERNLACAEDFLLDYGRRIFRRPLSASEMEQYLSFFEDIYYEDGFPEALEWTIAMLLQSPHFLYRSELGVGDGTGHFELTSWELATELSYLLWQTTPDQTLLSLAADGQILDPDILQNQVASMLLDPRANQTIVSLSQQWLSLNLLPIVPREGEYEVLTDEIRVQMAMEIEKMMVAAFSDNITLRELLTADHSFMSEELALYYGLGFQPQNLDEDGFRRMDLSNDSHYGGLLTQGALLTVHALPSSSSPVHRGVLIRERLLCQELPLPPANLDTSPPAMDPSKSTREKYEAHSVEPACSGCHDLIDPLGFGLEHYDGIGRWRALDGIHEVDASGVVTGIANGDVSFDGVKEMSSVLAEQPEVSQCFVQQWYTYGFGDGDREKSSVSCGLEEAFGLYGELGETLQSPLLALTRSERFLEREGDPAEGDSFAIDSTYVESNPPDDDVPGGENPDLEVYVVEDSNWGAGYCNTVSVTNRSAGDITWEITLEVPGTISSLWSAEEVSNDGYSVVFVGVEWNETLASGASTSFGFCAEM